MNKPLKLNCAAEKSHDLQELEPMPARALMPPCGRSRARFCEVERHPDKPGFFRCLECRSYAVWRGQPPLTPIWP